jgi:hypothetical protein
MTVRHDSLAQTLPSRMRADGNGHDSLAAITLLLLQHRYPAERPGDRGLLEVPSRLGQPAPPVGSRNQALASLTPVGHTDLFQDRENILARPGHPVAGPAFGGAAT